MDKHIQYIHTQFYWWMVFYHWCWSGIYWRRSPETHLAVLRGWPVWLWRKHDISKHFSGQWSMTLQQRSDHTVAACSDYCDSKKKKHTHTCPYLNSFITVCLSGCFYFYRSSITLDISKVKKGSCWLMANLK